MSLWMEMYASVVGVKGILIMEIYVLQLQKKAIAEKMEGKCFTD